MRLSNHFLTLTLSNNLYYIDFYKTRNRQACRDDYVHNVHTAGLHTSDRLLLEAVRKVNLFDRLFSENRVLKTPPPLQKK